VKDIYIPGIRNFEGVDTEHPKEGVRGKPSKGGVGKGSNLAGTRVASTYRCGVTNELGCDCRKRESVTYYTHWMVERLGVDDTSRGVISYRRAS